MQFSSSILTASLLVAMTGCSQAKPLGLAIEGCNYTNRNIVDFTVTDEDGNGAWGGDVLLSTPTAGGGKFTCCVMLGPSTRHPIRLKIKWAVEGIYDSSGKAVLPDVQKETWVTVSPPYPPEAHNFEVHFYPDGHVEAAVTHWSSPPRISLPENRKPVP